MKVIINPISFEVEAIKYDDWVHREVRKPTNENEIPICIPCPGMIEFEVICFIWDSFHMDSLARRRRSNKGSWSYNDYASWSEPDFQGARRQVRTGNQK